MMRVSHDFSTMHFPRVSFTSGYVPVSSSLNYKGSVLAVLFQATVEVLASSQSDMNFWTGSQDSEPGWIVPEQVGSVRISSSLLCTVEKLKVNLEKGDRVERSW